MDSNTIYKLTKQQLVTKDDELTFVIPSVVELIFTILMYCMVLRAVKRYAYSSGYVMGNLRVFFDKVYIHVALYGIIAICYCFSDFALLFVMSVMVSGTVEYAYSHIVHEELSFGDIPAVAAPYDSGDLSLAGKIEPVKAIEGGRLDDNVASGASAPDDEVMDGLALPGKKGCDLVVQLDPVSLDGLEGVGGGLEFRPHPALIDYGGLAIRGRFADGVVNYIGRVYLGKKAKHVGYGVFVGVFFITLTSFTTGGDIVVVAPTLTVRPYLWKSNGGFAIYYVGVVSPLKITLDDSVGPYVGLCTTTAGAACSRFSVHDVVREPNTGIVTSTTGAPFDEGLMGVGLPLMNDKLHVRGLYTSQVYGEGMRFLEFTDSVETVMNLRSAPIVLARMHGYDPSFR